jgi:EAL domain-containing protein (putative c-di-GMP-specific phosphodiesterase class I)
MRAVKQLGGNGQRFYTSTMNEQAVERLLLENQLARAVNGGQLVLHYQPQVSLTDGHLVGLEALVRWQHPELGLVSPGVFIPLAEETGLIEEIGDWVLEEACRQLAEWREAHLPVVMMAVNISAPQFTRQPICQRVSELLAKYQLPSSLLELELTERVVMHDPAHVREVMNNLAALGVQLSMDDFGTGYSSLSYLQKFPLDKLKIDMSFVRNIASSKDDLAIAKAIIQLGHSLDLTVIAEGVETIEQKLLLKQAGCQEGQGYYFAKPLPAEKVAELLKQPLGMSKGVFG